MSDIKPRHGLYTTKNPEALKILNKMNLTGIYYDHGDPDFTPVAVANVDIPMMNDEREHNRKIYSGLPSGTNQRPVTQKMVNRLFGVESGDRILSNYTQADLLLALRWNEEARNGRTDWSVQDVRKYRKKKQLTWHERGDMHNMDLVPRCINLAFPHLGGTGKMEDYRAECDEINRWLEEHDLSADAQLSYNQLGCCSLQMNLSVGLAIGLAATFYNSHLDGLWDIILWCVSAFSPYVLFYGLCALFGGVPQFFRTPLGNFLLIFGAGTSLLLIPTFVDWLRLLTYLTQCAFFLFLLSLMPSVHVLTKRTYHEDGSYTDKDVYSFSDEEHEANVSRAYSEGYRPE